MLYTCSGDVGGGLRQMTVLQHGAANKHKRKNKLTICNWKMQEITKNKHVTKVPGVLLHVTKVGRLSSHVTKVGRVSSHYILDNIH